MSFKIAEMAVKLAASRLLILYAARVLDRGEPARKDGAVANYSRLKLRSTWRTSLCKSMRGIGHTKDLPVERHFRDAKFMMVRGGTSEVMRYIIQGEAYKEVGRPS